MSFAVTPPGWWHSHHNESGESAWVLPIQDAGLFTHQRTLDIRFVDDELALHHSGRIRGSAFTVADDQYMKMKELGGQAPRASTCEAIVVDDINLLVEENHEEKKEQDGVPTKRRGSIQVGHLARQSSHDPSTPTHNRRASIQVGADLEFLKSLSPRSIAFPTHVVL